MEAFCELLQNYLKQMVPADIEQVQRVVRRVRRLAQQSTMWMPVYERVVVAVQSTVCEKYAGGRLLL
eukprot:6763378-Pyramimonas_sp.AAC.1